MSDYLSNNWKDLTEGLPENTLYENLVKHYNSKGRFYHNLNHIEALLKLSDEHKHLLLSKKTIDFAIWYHDVIYDASKSNNEEKSAELARKDLTDLGLNTSLIENCFDLIIATKTHQLSEETNAFDAQFLLDLDLSILAVDRYKHIEYTRQIRKEYQVYSNFVYTKGRKKVLSHFLEMDHIYKIELFRNLWENKAKENLKAELSLLEKGISF